tara:strand:- start:50897 stop:51247 length:351 start_codon:yes stop_codon:yes gene_type:complete
MIWFLQFLCQWWRIDRVRVGPTTGRLIALNIGDQFIYRERLFKVVDRTVNGTALTNTISLSLNCVDGKEAQEKKSPEPPSIRIVQCIHDLRTIASICCDGQSLPIFDDDVMKLKSK